MPTQRPTRPDLPLLYSCSGCSSAAQLANHLAVRMDRSGQAEMSCIVGLGGDVKPLVTTARSGRPIIMIDGCPLHCGRHTLERHDLVPVLHWDLSRRGIKKVRHADFAPADAARLEAELTGTLARLSSGRSSAPGAAHDESKCRTVPPET
ncbi:MAG TPA: putative zinc-binding protein [Opitutaceae bacterium]|jgi:uncharacterized metal-binding protein|nr:putative zinc-binding protein [Opitutaceae bacterium]HRE05283.1 putative zinc-binding protein [Opitutaceae bacterium]